MTDGFAHPAGPRRAAKLEDVRRSNEMLILGQLRIHPGLSNADISRQTGLAPQTVSVIVGDLMDHKLIVAGPVIRGRRGQPATPKYLNPEAVYAIGCEVGWRHADVLLIDFTGQILQRWHTDFAYPDPETLVQSLSQAVNKLRDSLPEQNRKRIEGVGLARPSNMASNITVVDPPASVVSAWQSLDLEAGVETATGLPVMLVNDGNAACQAEFCFGPGSRQSDMAVLFVSSFVGAGLVIEGRLFKGPSNNSANLGSSLVAKGTEVYVAHHLAGLRALDRRLEAAGKQGVAGFRSLDDWQQPECLEWVADASHALAFAIANSVAVIEFDAAYIDGRLPATVRDLLVRRTEEELAKLPRTSLVRPEVRAGTIGEHAPALGAAAAPLLQRYFGHDVRTA